jgi:diguanylate cyclase (GGDEF)-like protein
MIIAADVSAERRAQADLRRAMQQLALLAATDGLTGLSNHRAFQERLAQECARAERHQAAPALLMLDVDHFKQYNDAFGHPAGDAVLRRVADVLRRETRAEDMAARYGGEEFAILLPDVPAACAEDAAERVRTAVGGEHWDLRPITVSVGIGVWQPGLPPSALVKRADDALYLSKQRGRDRVTRWRG